TKEGLLWDDKIVSNLHGQMSRELPGIGAQESGSIALGIICTRHYGARRWCCRAVSIVSVRRCYSR
ncbi:hypothetical protein, partial [Streptomyces scabiei]|uniref:hypothetical protein n=1 Tax=Streptomyces scabiei TaxID=1930 RepID=UPI0038F762F0